MPSSYRAYLGENMYSVSATSPYQVVKSSLMGEDPTTLTTIPCADRPAITAVIPGHLILACNGGPIKQVVLVSVDDGQTAVIFQRRMTAPVMSFASWTGQWVYWFAEQWTEPGGLIAWGLVDGHGRPAPKEVLRQFEELPAATEVLNDLDGNFFIVRDQVLEKWEGSRFSPVGRLGGQRLEAAGDGQVIVSTVESLPSDIVGTYTLETLSPLRKIVSWTVHGAPVVGMTYSINYGPGWVDLYFPLQHKRYFFEDVIGWPMSANGQIYFRSSHGYERLVIVGKGMHTMTQPPGAGGFWP
ncbi:MAG: hypothetical protein QJR08_04435 [Bacillota bacterium]|nr:hypothetical protein [Bacillota bacterium]